MINVVNTLEVLVAQTGGELAEIERFRYSIYIEEMHKPLPWANHDEKRLPDPDDGGALQLYIREVGEVAACLRIHFGNAPAAILDRLGVTELVSSLPGPVVYLSKMMVGGSLRGAQHSKALMRHGFQIGVERGFHVALCNSRPELVPYYRKIGLYRFGEPFIDECVGRQVPMVMLGHDAEHFERVGSFLAPLARQYSRDPIMLRELQHEFLVKRYPIRELRDAA